MVEYKKITTANLTNLLSRVYNKSKTYTDEEIQKSKTQIQDSFAPIAQWLGQLNQTATQNSEEIVKVKSDIDKLKQSSGSNSGSNESINKETVTQWVDEAMQFAGAYYSQKLEALEKENSQLKVKIEGLESKVLHRNDKWFVRLLSRVWELEAYMGLNNPDDDPNQYIY